MQFDVQDFEADVLRRSMEVPVVVDFWAEWCAPCRILGPVLERLAAQSAGRWILAKVNIEEHPETARQYAIQSIPNVTLFYERKVISEFLGALPEYLVVSWLKKNLPSKHQREIELAGRLINEKRSGDAQALLVRILDEEPDNQEVKLLLAKTYLFDQPGRARELLKDVDDPKFSEFSTAITTFLRLFDILENPGQLEGRPIKDRYLTAISHILTQNFDSALETLLTVIRTDRYYDDDGSRKACIAIFKFLGEEHPLTQKHRREFSSALYV